MLETSWQVCWGKLELNSAGHRPSRTKFGHPCFKQSNILNGLYFCPSQPHFHSKIMYYFLGLCHYCLLMVIVIHPAPTCRTCRKLLRTFTTRTSARSASNGAAGCPPMVIFCLCRLRTYCSACLSSPPPSTSMKKKQLCECSHRIFEYPKPGKTKWMY